MAELGTAALRRLKKKRQKEKEQQSPDNLTKSQSVPGTFLEFSFPPFNSLNFRCEWNQFS